MDPDTAVLFFAPDRAGLDRGRVEGDAVVGTGRRRDLLEHGAQVRLGGVPEPEQVEVPRGTVRVAGPDGEEGGPLEHEAPRVARRGQAVEEPLVHEAQEDELEVVTALLGQAEQADARSGADVRLPFHARASR